MVAAEFEIKTLQDSSKESLYRELVKKEKQGRNVHLVEHQEKGV